MKEVSIVTRDLQELVKTTENIYESIVIISKRSRQISMEIKEELSGKLAEFATNIDTLEEVFENREQIEISKFYERMPKATILATEAFLKQEIYFSNAPLDEDEV